jgi:tetratricopeptide (TPR) repeat protein
MTSYLRSVSALLFLCGTTLSCFGQTVTERLAKLYLTGQLDAVVAQGKQELAAHPEQPIVSLIVGRAYADKQQFEQAVPYLTRSLTDARTPTDEKAWSKAYLGHCYYGLQQYPEARKALEEVVAQAATKNVTSYATQRLPLARAAELATKWETLETKHFRFRFQNPKSINSLQAYAAMHEQAYETNNRFFQATVPRKIDFFVWQDGLEASKVLGQELGFTQPYMVTIHVLPNQTYGHEITHMLTQYGLQPTQKTKLINEGVAVCFDQTNRNRLQAARQQISGPTDVWKMWEQPDLFPSKQVYAVGGALLEYLLAHASEAEVKQILRNQTPQMGRQLFSRQVADFERELTTPDPTAAKSIANAAPATPVKLTAAQVNAVVERSNAADKYYKVLVLLNGVPVTGAHLEQQNPQQIRDLKVLKSKEEIRAYTEVELNGIILVATGS